MTSSNVVYGWGLYKQTVKRPVISSWVLWTVLGFILLIAYKDAGAHLNTTLLLAIFAFLNPLVITILAWRYGTWSWSKLDTWCVIIFILTVIAWKVSNIPLVGLFGGVFAGCVSVWPQLYKNWAAPSDGTWLNWILFAFGCSISFLAIEHWYVAQWIYPAYLVLSRGLIGLPVVLNRLGFYK